MQTKRKPPAATDGFPLELKFYFSVIEDQFSLKFIPGFLADNTF